MVIYDLETSSEHYVIQQDLLAENRQVPDFVPVNFGDDEKVVC